MKRLFVPDYENPYERFFSGRGELGIEDTRTGSRCNAGFIWNVVLRLPEDWYPVQIGTERFSKADLIDAMTPNIDEVLTRMPQADRHRVLAACGLLPGR